MTVRARHECVPATEVGVAARVLPIVGRAPQILESQTPQEGQERTRDLHLPDSPAPPHLAGKDVTVTFGVSLFRGYVYAKDDVLYATNTSHVSTHELEELLSKLP